MIINTYFHFYITFIIEKQNRYKVLVRPGDQTMAAKASVILTVILFNSLFEILQWKQNTVCYFYILIFSHHLLNLKKDVAINKIGMALLSTTVRFMSNRNLRCFDAKQQQ